MLRGYNNYRGRSGKQGLLAIPLVILLLLSLGYLLIQNFLVYDAQGNVTVKWPFSWGQEDGEDDGSAAGLPGTSGPEEELTLIIEKPDSVVETEEPLRAVERTAAEFLAGAGPAAGSNAVVVELKGEKGAYAYTSTLAVEGALAEDAVSRDKLVNLLAGDRDWTAVAALHTLHDTHYAFANMAGAGICQTSGYIWYDSTNTHWLQPAKEGARAYLSELARECVDMGFDEILLRELTYPTAGKLQRIDYSDMAVTKEEALAAFLEGLREALAGRAVLSLQVNEELILEGAKAASGQDIRLLAPLVDRLWVETNDPDAVWAALETYLPEGTVREQYLVVIGETDAAEDGAVLP